MENFTIYKINKYSIPIELGIGTLNKNPEEFIEQNSFLLRKLPRYIYIKYENVWYQTKLNHEKLQDIAMDIMNKTYNKEQYLQKIISCI